MSSTCSRYKKKYGRAHTACHGENVWIEKSSLNLLHSFLIVSPLIVFLFLVCSFGALAWGQGVKYPLVREVPFNPAEENILSIRPILNCHSDLKFRNGVSLPKAKVVVHSIHSLQTSYIISWVTSPSSLNLRKWKLPFLQIMVWLVLNLSLQGQECGGPSIAMLQHLEIIVCSGWIHALLWDKLASLKYHVQVWVLAFAS